MKSILLRLYDCEICPAEQFNLKTEEYRSMRQAHYQHYEDFTPLYNFLNKKYRTGTF